MSSELHGQKINPFEQGYAAFLKGISLSQNPFDTEKNSTPFAKQRWTDGWDKAQRESWRRS